MSFVIADRVKETSTTTGTGALSLAGAQVGFRSFSSVCSVGDTCYYAVQAVDGSGAPTGEWETGYGTYSGANTLTRTTVLASSNANAAVNFASGTKQVWVTVPAAQAAWPRERLTASRTYYVRTDGSNSNDGLSNTSGGAFLTIQKAIDVASGLDNGGFDITITVAAGTYTGANTFRSIIGSGKIIIAGGAADLTSTIVSTTSADCFSNLSGFYGNYQLQYLKLQTTTSGIGINTAGAGIVSFNNLNFGSCVTGHIQAGIGCLIKATGNYTISGGSQYHISALDGGAVWTPSLTLTFSGSNTFSYCFVTPGRCGTVLATSMTFSGSFTGQRYIATLNGVISTGTGNTSYFPGTVAGTTSTGGQYS